MSGIENENGSANMRGMGTEREIWVETRGSGMAITIASRIGIGITINGIIVG